MTTMMLMTMMTMAVVLLRLMTMYFTEHLRRFPPQRVGRVAVLLTYGQFTPPDPTRQNGRVASRRAV